MQKYYLAVDIGASSGRHMIAWIEDGELKLEEVYRFSNEMEPVDGQLCWNVERLFQEILTGLKRCKAVGRIPSYMGVDTWGVDFVLLDSEDRMLGQAVGYRDKRTYGMDEKLGAMVSAEELYQRTGIQKQIFNTIYQLMAVKEKQPDLLKKAEALLMIPDYFHFRLTGVKKMEYTNATTGQLIHAETGDWDYELIERCGFPRKLFSEISMPGTLVGGLQPEIEKEVGYSCQVVLPATHDTGSAVMAVPTNEEHAIYISSGTWSLMGIERKTPDCTLESMRANFTNEGGYAHRYRFLKNIMGLWMIQSIKKEFAGNLSFSDLCELAEQESIPSIVDCNDESFLAPESMIRAVQDYCRKTGQTVPEGEGEIAAVIYNSLAKCYAATVQEIEAITGQSFQSIYVVGGGSNADYLNKLTADYTGRKVFAGPSEATAIGNVIAQLLYDGSVANLEEARSLVRNSFKIGKYGS